MTPEELSRIRQVYQTAITLTGADLEAYIDRACQGEAELQREVERLIGARDRVPAWLEKPVFGLSLRSRAPAPPMDGRRLSGYTLIRQIGRGGMGSVYLAERSDGAFRKEVAIKIMLPSANTTEIVSGFQQEREILASLDHPNIARLIDGGATEEGWPYFVMEHVDGQAIHRWCDERKLNISQRIELFCDVLEAIRYAHQRLVVHMDLKPSNILVTADGTVKLLDFGIAKVLSVEENGSALAARGLAHRMTPEYASPEQINGGPITTFTDIYSLGVILYQLLTGHRPYRLRTTDASDIARVIAEVEPTPPSQMIATAEPGFGSDATLTPAIVSAVREGDPGKLRKRLAGDLDAILLRALQKKPEHRYGSVESFADDLQRHLHFRPVASREASAWYLVRSFIRRNPSGVASGVLLAISVLSGLAAVVWQARRSIEEARVNPGADAFLGPVWVIFYGATIVILGAAIYFARPNKGRLIGAFAGGAVWAATLWGKYWIGDSLGWWRSRLAAPDPFSFFLPPIWLGYSLAAMSMLLLMFLTGRRFGWQGQVVFLGTLGFFVETRERFWFSVLLPALTYSMGAAPLLASVAIIIIGGILGLLTMRLIAGPAGKRASARREALRARA